MRFFYLIASALKRKIDKKSHLGGSVKAFSDE